MLHNCALCPCCHSSVLPPFKKTKWRSNKGHKTINQEVNHSKQEVKTHKNFKKNSKILQFMIDLCRNFSQIQGTLPPSNLWYIFICGVFLFVGLQHCLVVKSQLNLEVIQDFLMEFRQCYENNIIFRYNFVLITLAF